MNLVIVSHNYPTLMLVYDRKAYTQELSDTDSMRGAYGDVGILGAVVPLTEGGLTDP